MMPALGWVSPAREVGMLIDVILTADDLNDWLGPVFRFAKAMDQVEPQARRAMLQADRDQVVRAAHYRLMTETLNSLGSYWGWQNNRTPSPSPDRWQDLTKGMSSLGLSRGWQEGPNLAEPAR